jgi:hypothetical protein
MSATADAAEEAAPATADAAVAVAVAAVAAAEAATAAAEAAAPAAAAAGASSFLPQAARATAATSEARTRDLFMVGSSGLEWSIENVDRSERPAQGTPPCQVARPARSVLDRPLHNRKF